jgi:hypothetical protein
MAKRKSKSKPVISPFFDGKRVAVEVKPEDASFLRLIDTLSAFAAYDPEKEYEQRVKEGERQLEIVAAQILARHEKELARRAECRRLRLEREAAEKAAAEAESRSKSPRQPRNRVRKVG